MQLEVVQLLEQLEVVQLLTSDVAPRLRGEEPPVVSLHESGRARLETTVLLHSCGCAHAVPAPWGGNNSVPVDGEKTGK